MVSNEDAWQRGLRSSTHGLQGMHIGSHASAEALRLTSLRLGRAAEILASCSAGLVELYLQRGVGAAGKRFTHLNEGDVACYWWLNQSSQFMALVSVSVTAQCKLLLML